MKVVTNYIQYDNLVTDCLYDSTVVRVQYKEIVQI